MQASLRPTLVLFMVLSLVTGLAYPLLLTGIGQLAFPEQAAGSLLRHNGQIVGSRLIGQHFDTPGYFWGRPSATAPQANNGAASSGSNVGPLNPALQQAVSQRVAALRAADPQQQAPVPVDLVTSSASGLDPDISPAAALYQVGRVARVRGLDSASVQALVQRHIQPRQWGVLGASRVNVLQLNLALDQLTVTKPSPAQPVSAHTFQPTTSAETH